MYDGELGVLPGRSPLIGRLGPGELRTRRGNETKRWFVDGGFAQVRANVVTVLTPRAIDAEKIDVQAAQQTLQSSRGATTNPDAQLKTQQRARVQIHIAQRGRGGSPAGTSH
jgi:F-type H+-transporting ATPase subunit epsilon